MATPMKRRVWDLLLIMTAAMLVSNFVVDLSYVLLDPRLKKA